MLHAFPPVCPQGQGQRPLRPALRCVRPGPGPHRGGVGEGRAGEDGRQRRPALPGACHGHQGAARRAREAPRFRALERLLQAPALREVPGAAPAGQRHPQGSLGPPRARPTRRRARRLWTTSPRSTRSSGRPRRPDPASLVRTRSAYRRPERRCDGPGAVVFGGPYGPDGPDGRSSGRSQGVGSGPGQIADASSRSGSGRRTGRTGTAVAWPSVVAVQGAGRPE